MKNKLGKKIALRMKTLGLSKNQTCQWAHIQPHQLNNIIYGTSAYTIDILIRVLETLDLTLEAKAPE